jgi:hypothetical protein
MSIPDKYLYTKLAEPDYFRLILLQPSPRLTAPRQLTIVTATLSQYEDDIVDHYVAVSYVWGNQKDIRAIGVDSKQLEITASLESALHHIRDASHMMKTWADGMGYSLTKPITKTRTSKFVKWDRYMGWQDLQSFPWERQHQSVILYGMHRRHRLLR